jgi:predicted GTPase
MGYGTAQVRDLEATIRAAVDAGDCEAVVAGTPIDLSRVLSVPVPLVRARYDLREQLPAGLESALEFALGRRDTATPARATSSASATASPAP